MDGMTVGGRIIGLRRSKKFSQKTLAAAAGISVQYLSDLENDRRPNPGARVLSDVAFQLDSTVRYLLDGEGPT